MPVKGHSFGENIGNFQVGFLLADVNARVPLVLLEVLTALQLVKSSVRVIDFIVI